MAQTIFNEYATTKTSAEDFISFLEWFPDPDEVLTKRGEDADVLDKLLADEQVLMEIQKRKIGTLLKKNFSFSPDEDSGQATTQEQKLADDLNKDIKNIDTYNLINQLLDAPHFGLTIPELMWEPAIGRIRLKTIFPKPRKWFAFNSGRELIFKSKDNLQGVVVPENKFSPCVHMPSYDNPYGVRLLSRCLWPVVFKKGGIRFWTNFIEKFGTPWVVGEASQNAIDADRANMTTALYDMVQTGVAVLSYGSKVDLKEPGSSTSEAHREYYSTWNNAISKVLTGQTLTSELGSVGSQAAAQTHLDVLNSYQEADQLLVKSFFDDVSKIYTKLNAEGLRPPVFNYSESKDYQPQAELTDTLSKSGVKFTKSYYIRKFDLLEDDIEDTVSTPSDNNDKEQFAKGDNEKEEIELNQDRLDAFVDDVLPEAEKAIKLNTNKIIGMVKNADSYDAMLAGLDEIMAGKDNEQLLSLTQKSILGSMLSGFSSAEKEAE